ncbi:hypothetical protein B0J13DRAFT_639578 [Dactylonectria estremocensis]|uniref:Uncharacterized protein n=1 Tax=Dactylonectria estremocensis TaxID=1079267 RepID=A0A9P9EHK6_9HYPO|nr:hypothetical protein B0J13DRAFT_639578 [Dactylonectria estremocensis]
MDEPRIFLAHPKHLATSPVLRMTHRYTYGAPRPPNCTYGPEQCSTESWGSAAQVEATKLRTTGKSRRRGPLLKWTDIRKECSTRPEVSSDEAYHGFHDGKVLFAGVGCCRLRVHPRLLVPAAARFVVFDWRVMSDSLRVQVRLEAKLSKTIDHLAEETSVMAWTQGPRDSRIYTICSAFGTGYFSRYSPCFERIEAIVVVVGVWLVDAEIELARTDQLQSSRGIENCAKQQTEPNRLKPARRNKQTQDSIHQWPVT